MKQKYYAHHKGDSTVRRAFVIIFVVLSSIQFIFFTDRLIYLCFYLTGFEWGFNCMPCSEEIFYSHINDISKKNLDKKQ